MKVKIAILPLFVLLMASCGSNHATPTYTITIEEANHFTPSKTSFTFKENDFTPIVLTYTIDDDYYVHSAKASDDAATCRAIHKEEEKNEIEIIPSKNMNFTVTVNITHLSEVSIVRIKDADHFTPSTKWVVFKNYDWNPITIPYQVDDYVSLDAYVSKGIATCSLDVENSTLTVTPNGNGEIEITVESTEEYRRVHFVNPQGSGELGPYADEYINIPFNHNWGGFVEVGRQTAVWDDYGFKGWSFTQSTELGGDVIPFDYRFTKEDSDTAYAVFEHKVNMTSESLAVEKEVYVGSSNEETVQIYFRLRHKDERYDFPLDETYFTITNSDQSAITDFTYQYVGDETPMPYIEIKRSDIKTGSINIAVNDYQPQYTFTHAEDVHLIYETIEGKETPKKYEDFKFNIIAKQDSNGPAYYVPDNIIVEVDGQRIADRFYKIEFADPNHQNATVTIYREKVLGNINVRATAAFKDAYHYQVSGYGVNIDSDTSSYLEGYQYYSGQGGESVTIKLHETATGGEISDSNIVIKVNDTDWYTYDTFQTKYPNIVSFDWTKEPNELVISPINKDDTGIDTLSFHIIAPNYSVFENASWAELKEICSAPAEYMDDMFVVGETKQVTIANIKYDLHIIDINKDEIAGQDNKKAALTIEFEDVICNDDGSTHKDKFCNYTIGNYDDETYDNYLNKDFFEKLPIEMSDCIKTVKKQVYEQDPVDYRKMTAKVFALSYEELGLSDSERQHKEGTAYEYYNSAGNDKRTKYNIKSEATSYWTRSISQTARKSDSIYIKTDGSSNFTDNYDDIAYMAAFCI